MTAIALAIVLVVSPMAESASRDPESVIEVFRSHKRGSSIPARVERWDLHRYTAAVMMSGAWPGWKPRESLKVGAIAIRQYATWHMRHRQRGYSWRGNGYDIRDNDQYLRRELRPWSHIPDRYLRVVRETRSVRLYKGGRYFRTGWRGGSGRDGWHLYEQSITRMARRGWGWPRIVRQQLAPVEVSR